LQCWARGLLKGHGQFVGDDGSESRFAQTWRPVEQNMIQRFTAGTSCLDCHSQIFLNLGLSDEFREALGPELQLKRRIVFNRRGRYQSLLQIGNIFGGSH
jgi:hypothetical protein